MAKKYDESKLRPKQREAALMLVEREFAPKDQRKTKQQICEELEIDISTLWRWEFQDENFIAYRNHIADTFMDANLTLVYSRLLDGIKNGSMKGIELYLKRSGKLTDVSKAEVTVEDKRDRESLDERQRALEERLKALGVEEGGE